MLKLVLMQNIISLFSFILLFTYPQAEGFSYKEFSESLRNKIGNNGIIIHIQMYESDGYMLCEHLTNA